MQRPLRRNQRRIGRFVVAALVGLALTTVPARPAAATYPGANGRIAYEIVDDDGPTHLWWANPDLFGAQQLTFGDYDTFDPAWSADGRVLVYSTVQYATEPPPLPGFRVDVGTLNVVTGEQHVLTTGGHVKENPSFSPDGTRILFAKTDPSGDNEPGLYTMRASDGGDVDEVTGIPKGIDYLQYPRYSPDGSQISFTPVKEASWHQEGRAPREGAVYAVKADGSELRRLTPFGDLLNFTADWSPDGSQLVMQTDWRPGTRPSLWIMNADGTNLRRLTDEAPYPSNRPFQASFGPTWAPDGSVIMFNCAPGQLSFWDFCIIRPDGTDRTLVHSTPEFEHRPAWQPRP
jgi:Tol biopolymer transport system component